MKAYELPVKVTPEGELELPETLRTLLPRDQVIRLIILIPEPSGSKEQDAWARLTAEQFLEGYSEADSIYDTI